MHKKYYLVLDSTTALTTDGADITWALQRHIPNGSKMRLLQFNWHMSSGSLSIDPDSNGLVLHLQNVGQLDDFNVVAVASGQPQLASTCILAQIPQEALFVPANVNTPRVEGNYEAYNPCVVNITAPMTSINIVVRNSTYELISSTDFANFEYSVLLEIEEKCSCE